MKAIEWQTSGQFKRRLNVYAPRMLRMLARREPKHRCWFMHIPKSGGSSVHEALRATVPLNRHVNSIGALETRRAASILHEDRDDLNLVHEDGPACTKLFDLREAQLLSAMAHGDHLIYGHVLFSERADRFFAGDYKYVTVLREPVERVISNYRSCTHEKFFEGSFDEYLDSDVAKLHSRLNLRYFSGVAKPDDDQISVCLDKAKEHMETFSIIGFIDAIEQFSTAYEQVFGMRPDIPHYNSAKGQAIELSDVQVEKLRALCEPDLILHEYAKGLASAAL